MSNCLVLPQLIEPCPNLPALLEPIHLDKSHIISPKKRKKEDISGSDSEEETEAENSELAEEAKTDAGNDTDTDINFSTGFSPTLSEEENDEDKEEGYNEEVEKKKEEDLSEFNFSLCSDKLVVTEQHVKYEQSVSDPYWTYLMCAPSTSSNTERQAWNGRKRKRSHGYKTKPGNWQTHVGKSRNPIGKVYEHNIGKTDSKSTRAGAPNWTLVAYFGPFRNKNEAFMFLEVWRHKRRGLRRRLDYILNDQYFGEVTDRNMSRGLTPYVNVQFLQEIQYCC